MLNKLGIRIFKNTGFSLIELLLIVAIIGILAATAIPSFESYTRRSKTSEPIMALTKMMDAEVSYYNRTSTFLSAGPINIPPVGTTISFDFNTDPGFAEMGFALTGVFLYGYEAIATAPNEVDCRAVGDLDRDGTTSLFTRHVSVEGEGHFLKSNLYVFDELE